MWVLTVLRLMWSSWAISTLVRPPARLASTSSSRSVSGSTGSAGGSSRPASANAARRRAVTLGAIRASPAAAALHRLRQQLGAGVLEQEPARAGLQRGVHVLVQVERGDDDHRHRAR